ncbi:ribonuclease H-like domain-containing protein [Stenotrophomonas maltophilia]|uniref:ribonuclease H-like domain-containing protein n=1 Tax=Stenotrophomonas maltophilia TaxID=40324 RepID=UPI002896179D|nr:ribonuclease H-like domain-containing protein [Stenotrophomonas maltophilia]MDT3502047.1 ribonuclease H-like domain-containing protein [Stenotrophomonas maltophilia]
MSLSLDKLRLLRKQAGDPKVGPPDVTAAAPAAVVPAAANDARQPPAERSVFAWVEQEIRHKPTGPAAKTPAPTAPPLRQPHVGSLHRLLGLRTRGSAAPLHATAQDRRLPGEEIAPGLFLIESLQPQPVPKVPLSLAFARRENEHVAAHDLLFFDTETTGLAGGTGTRAFMIGAADWYTCPQRGEGLRIRQLLISTMAAEEAMLATFAGWLQPSTVFCSYNGRSYDAPLLKARYRLARQRDPISALDHVDLLYPTRRRYRGTWENCRLSTIERQLLRVIREDDLPGSEAPGAWLRFLRGGDAVNLRRVADHNHQDVVTLALLLQRLVREEAQERELLALQAPPGMA